MEKFGSIKYPIVTPIAMKLSILAVQSANVERACKAHGVIHTKARNRLKNGTVQKLLYCYMNLRLLYNHEKLYEVSNFIESEIERIDNNGGHDNEIGIGDSSEGEDDITNTIDISQMLNESVTREKLKVPNNNVSTSEGIGLCAIVGCRHQILNHDHSCYNPVCPNFVHNLCAQENGLVVDGTLKMWCCFKCKDNSKE